ncbi:MAG: hypothetical protein VXX18_02580 [Bacteroidota bacterium]|nr:hypothetical protein [Bacteroidota bacterium]
MKIRKYILWTILTSLILSAAPTATLYSQITRDDVTTCIMLSCNQVSLRQAQRDAVFNSFSEPCLMGDCKQDDLMANINGLPPLNQSLTLQIIDLTTEANLDLDAQQLAEALITELYVEGKLKGFLDRNPNRKEMVAAELQGWLEIFINARKTEATDPDENYDFPDQTQENQSSDEIPANTQNNQDNQSSQDDNEDVRGEDDGDVVEEEKSGSNLVFIIIILLLLGVIGLLAFLYYKLNLEKEDLEQSTKRLRDESAQFNAEQYKLKRLLSERERELRSLMESQQRTQIPKAVNEEVVEKKNPDQSNDIPAQEVTGEIPFNQVEDTQVFNEEENQETKIEEAAKRPEDDNPGHVSYPPNIEGQRSVVFFSAPNAQGEFPSSAMMRDYSPEAVIRVFLRDEEADYGEFQIVTNPTSQRNLLANWEHTLAHFAVPVNPEHPEPRSIELERAGGIRESQGVWKVVRKAKVRFM